MEKTRQIKIISICALLVAVLGLTVAFAALSQTLTINGSAAVNAASWDIHFEKTSGKETEVKGAATFTEPTLSGTTIENFSATLTKPGDSVTYYFDIVNKGTIDAQIENYNFPNAFKDCMASINKYSYCMNFDFNSDGVIDALDLATYFTLFNHYLKYADTDKSVRQGDTINAGETKHMKLVIEYKDTATELPKNNLTLTSSDPITITYEQKN
ncbi:MAG: hypothetical protein ACLUD7_03070 [Lachnospiraceae bacterium]